MPCHGGGGLLLSGDHGMPVGVNDGAWMMGACERIKEGDINCLDCKSTRESNIQANTKQETPPTVPPAPRGSWAPAPQPTRRLGQQPFAAAVIAAIAATAAGGGLRG